MGRFRSAKTTSRQIILQTLTQWPFNSLVFSSIAFAWFILVRVRTSILDLAGPDLLGFPETASDLQKLPREKLQSSRVGCRCDLEYSSETLFLHPIGVDQIWIVGKSYWRNISSQEAYASWNKDRASHEFSAQKLTTKITFGRVLETCPKKAI